MCLFRLEFKCVLDRLHQKTEEFRGKMQDEQIKYGNNDHHVPIVFPAGHS